MRGFRPARVVKVCNAPRPECSRPAMTRPSTASIGPLVNRISCSSVTFPRALWSRRRIRAFHPFFHPFFRCLYDCTPYPPWPLCVPWNGSQAWLRSRSASLGRLGNTRSVVRSCSAQVQLNTWRSLGTFIGPFSSTVLCVLPKEPFRALPSP